MRVTSADAVPQPPSYTSPRIARNLAHAARGAFLAIVLMHSAACAVLMPIDSLIPDPTETGSIGAGLSAFSGDLDAEDQRRADSALTLAVDPQGAGLPVVWENPATKRRGSFSPDGPLLIERDRICRPFSAELTAMTAATRTETVRYRGRACRTGPDSWMIAEAQPVEASLRLPLAALPLLPYRTD
jgi:surface antigen